MTKFVEEGAPALSTDQEEHFQMVHQGGYAYLTDETTLDVEMAKSCNLTSMQEQIFPMHYAFGFQNNSAYAEIFSQE